jgi:RimJ/RimL family protein N-acetyltransferase
MRYYREIQTRTGETWVLRNPEADDTAAVLAHMRLTSEETDNMVRYPDEITLSEESERTVLQRIADSPDEIMIAAFLNGTLAANGGFGPVLPCEKAHHRASFGISVQQAYWGRGLGSAILAGILESARQAGYRQVELDVVSGNDRAIALYRKFGFETYGTLEHGYLLRDGTWQTLQFMVCHL